jgi:hypothetical protein
MTILTPELRQEIEKAGEQPVRITDPETRNQYVLVKADVYDKMRAFMEAEQIDPSFYEYGDFIPLNP